MNKIRIMTIFGTRPEATKMAPLINELKQCNEIETFVCVSAQHRHMLDQVLEKFDITPDFDLNLMKHGQSISDITAGVLKGIEKILKETTIDLILVHGDTQTTFAGALAAFFGGVAVGHVEAGLRTYDKFQPFPEEMNRVLTTDLADIHFAPTSLSRQNLIKEGVNEKNIYVTGNTAIDCIKSSVSDNFKFENEELQQFNFKHKKIVVVTAHRRENLGLPLENICNALLKIVDRFQDVHVIYAVHKNPLVHDVVHSHLGSHPNILLTEPLDMYDMHNLLDKSFLVLTDSGGLQEEAPALDKPVLVMRNVTERPEGIGAGTLKLCGTESADIVNAVANLIENVSEYKKMADAKNPFGDGYASKRIVEAILHYYGRIDTKPDDF